MKRIETDPFYPIALDKLPSDWKVHLLGEKILDIQSGFPSGKHNREGLGIPHLRPMNISRDGKLVMDDLKSVADKNGPRLQKGDVLFNNTNSPELIGKTALINVEDELAFSNHMTRLRVPGDIDAAFLAHQLHFLWRSGYFKHRCTNHVNQASISAGVLAKTVPIAFPSLSAQKKIVKVLELNMSRLDSGMEYLVRVQAQHKRYRAAVLKAACEGKLAEMTPGPVAEPQKSWPDGWDLKSLAEIAECAGGLTKNGKREKLSKKMPYLRVANVYANELRLEEIEKIGVAPSEIARYQLQKGDVLIVEGNGSKSQIGRLAIWDGSIELCLHQNHLIRVRPRKEQFARWIQIWFQSPQGRAYIEKVAASTSGLFTLSVNKVKALPIAMPPLGELTKIVEEVERLLTVMDRQEALIKSLVLKGGVTRRALLQKAFSTDDEDTDMFTHGLFEVVENEADCPGPGFVVYIDEKIAAGDFNLPQLAGEGKRWIKVNTRRRLSKDMFVADIVGNSMEPSVPAGSKILFGLCSVPDQAGCFIFKINKLGDDEAGGRYNLKHCKFRNGKVYLIPGNPMHPERAYGPESGLSCVAKLLEVLGTSS